MTKDKNATYYRTHKYKLTVIILMFVNVVIFVSSCAFHENAKTQLVSETVFSVPTKLNPTLTTTAVLIPTDNSEISTSVTPSPATTVIPVISVLLQDIYGKDEVIPAHAYIYGSKEGHKIIFLDGFGKVISEILFEINDPTPIEFDSFNEPCTLNLVSTTGQEIVLDRYDLASRKSEIIFTGKAINDSWQTYPSLSFDGIWIAYVIWSGERYYQGAELQDIAVIHLPDGILKKVTQFHGASVYGGIWSPVEEKLAYSDYDEKHFQQLFLYDPKMDVRELISNFSDPDTHITPLSWSPDGNRLIFLKEWDVKDFGSELWVAHIELKQISKVNLPDFVMQISQKVYWQENRNLFFTYAIDFSGNLVMFLIDNNEVEKYWPMDEERQDFPYLEFPVPITKDLLTIGSFINGMFFDTNQAKMIIPTEQSKLRNGLVLDNIVIYSDLLECFINVN